MNRIIFRNYMYGRIRGTQTSIFSSVRHIYQCHNVDYTPHAKDLLFRNINTDSLNVFLFSEYIPGGEMFTHLYHSESFTEDSVRFYIGEIILALERLHEVY